MYKTKFGISVGLMGAIVCFLGAVVGIQWYLLGIVAYILVKEDNEWLRRLTIKVVVLLVASAVITTLVPYLFSFIYDIIDIFKDDIDMRDITWPNVFSTYITKYIKIIIDVILILAGLKALKQKHFSIQPVDNLISKNV